MQHLHSHVASIFLQIFVSDDAVVVTISDAKNCQEQEKLDGNTQNFKSQQACITALAAGNALNAEKIHPLSSSTRVRRVCRSALMSEAYALSNAVKLGLRTRATIVDERTTQCTSTGRNGLVRRLRYDWKQPNRLLLVQNR